MEGQILRTFRTSALVSKEGLRDKQIPSLMLPFTGSFTPQATFPINTSATNAQRDLHQIWCHLQAMLLSVRDSCFSNMGSLALSSQLTQKPRRKIGVSCKICRLLHKHRAVLANSFISPEEEEQLRTLTRVQLTLEQHGGQGCRALVQLKVHIKTFFFF